jgi:hypothetical protein
LVRIPACHVGGRGFESRPLRQDTKMPAYAGIFYCFRFLCTLGAYHFAEWREPPARLPAGLEGNRLQAIRRPAACRRVPSAPPRYRNARLCGHFLLLRLFFMSACGGISFSFSARLRAGLPDAVRFCIRIDVAAGSVVPVVQFTALKGDCHQLSRQPRPLLRDSLPRQRQ